MRKYLKEKIEECLEKYPETRNSDVALTNAIWLEYYKEWLFPAPDGNAAIRLSDLHELPNQDDVKRFRAKIQNEERRFLPTDPDVIEKRRLNQQAWYIAMQPSNPARG